MCSTALKPDVFSVVKNFPTSSGRIATLKALLVPYRLNAGDFRFSLPSVRLSVCQSVHPLNWILRRDNAKSTKNIFMKLDIWIDGSMEIVCVFFFSSYAEYSGCYGNK
jgi:hypothetical protein